MSYIIAIPSYKRANTLHKKTLSLLKKYDINLKEKVYIFVADETEYEIYKNTINENDYNKIIIGKHTLKSQRNFILNFFPVGTNIINLDDDLMDIMTGYKDKDTKEIITSNILSLNKVFEVGFEECHKVGASLFGFYPVYNKFFMSNTISYNLNAILGSCYGIINQQVKQYVYTDDKEDFERSIKCFINDGKVIRFNYISFKTKYYTEPGGLQETRTLETIQRGAEYILNTYPGFCKLKIKKNGRYEVVLKKPTVPRMRTKKVSPPVVLNIGQYIQIMNTQSKLLKLLDETTIKPIEGKFEGRNSRGVLLLENPDHHQYKGIVERPRTVTLGFGRRRCLGYGSFSVNQGHQELLDLLIEYGKLILPKDFIFTTITLNKNLKCKPHKDAGNFGVSAFTTLGNYTNGGIFIDDKLYSTKNNIILFDGAKLTHATEDFIGDRYALIFYKQNIKRLPTEFVYYGTMKYNITNII